MLTPSIIDRLRQLGLTTMAQALQQQLSDPDQANWSFEDRLGLLVDAEWAARESRGVARRVREAHLRLAATPEDLDYQAPRQLPRALVRQLLQGEWIRQHETVIITGPTGVGKTYLLCALGHAACRQHRRVRYYRLPRLLGEAAIARQTGQWLSWLRQLRRWDLLCLDDWGFSSLTVDESHQLLEIIDDRYQERATAIASQVPVDQWPALFPDATLGEAILDRLVHHAHRLTLTGESMRKVLPRRGPDRTTEPADPVASTPGTREV